ncbi:hypothetical protein DFH07DRAFT_783255 [Mycena maculata]|uniref:Uncharacterized protein n=1 Tax=Mycena maculata TaxID=230809 RepID=A0AAD7HN75_9AGAR|nr:hypothetical protein DFH07DRAFT_783255 [Mycena maculata]
MLHYSEPLLAELQLREVADINQWSGTDFDWISVYTAVYLAFASKSHNKLALHNALCCLNDAFLVNKDETTAENLFVVVLEGFTNMDAKEVAKIDGQLADLESEYQGKMKLLGGINVPSVSLEDFPTTGVSAGMEKFFTDKLRDVWHPQATHRDTPICIGISPWLRQTTLNVLRLTGFNYQFDALQSKGKPNELEQVFTDLLHSLDSPVFQVVMRAHSSRTSGETADEKMFSIAAQIVSESKATIEASEGQKTLAGRKDLLSVLLEAEMSPDVPESQRFSDAKVISHQYKKIFRVKIDTLQLIAVPKA